MVLDAERSAKIAEDLVHFVCDHYPEKDLDEIVIASFEVGISLASESEHYETHLHTMLGQILRTLHEHGWTIPIEGGYGKTH